MDITNRHDITRSDIRDATCFYYGIVGKLWRTATALLFFVVGVLSLFDPRIRGYGVVLLLCAAYQFAAPSVCAFFTARRYFSNPSLGRSIEMHITDSGIDAKSELGASSQSWSLFKTWMESPEAFLLVIYKGYYLVVPKRGFEREDDIPVLREFLPKTIGQAKV